MAANERKFAVAEPCAARRATLSAGSASPNSALPRTSGRLTRASAPLAASQVGHGPTADAGHERPDSPPNGEKTPISCGGRGRRSDGPQRRSSPHELGFCWLVTAGSAHGPSNSACFSRSRCCSSDFLPGRQEGAAGTIGWRKTSLCPSAGPTCERNARKGPLGRLQPTQGNR
jgi:hypothetical protein